MQFSIAIISKAICFQLIFCFYLTRRSEVARSTKSGLKSLWLNLLGIAFVTITGVHVSKYLRIWSSLNHYYQVPRSLTWITFNPLWISHSPIIVWDEITYPFPNFNGCILELWQWKSNFILHLSGHAITYPCYSRGPSDSIWCRRS